MDRAQSRMNLQHDDSRVIIQAKSNININNINVSDIFLYARHAFNPVYTSLAAQRLSHMHLYSDVKKRK